MVPILRDYQTRDLNAVRAAMREYDSVLLVQPTGAGKGTLASFIVHSAVARGKRCLFLVNRKTLVHDMASRLERLGIEHGVIMADDPRRKPWLSTHVASIDTLQRRENLPIADLLIIDETHFAVSPTWAKVLDRYKGVKRLHMTATPIRLDGRGLEEICDVMVMGPSVQELIDLKFLVPSVVFAPPRAVNTSGVRKTAGDFNQSALAQVCDQAKLVGDIVSTWKLRASERKIAVFAVDQKHAKHIQEQFNAAGIECAYVDAETPDDERQAIWDSLDAGTCRVVSSVGVISYGWDHPIVSCVVLARPTTSVGLHLQQIGRGSRPAPGKTNLLVLDHAGNTHRHGFYEDARQWSLTGRALAEEKEKTVSPYTCTVCRAVFRRGPLNCPYCGAAVVVQHRDIHVVKGELEELQRTQTAEKWQKIPLDKQEIMYRKFVLIGQQRGYSPKWAPVRFAHMFGRYPPREWNHPRKMEAYA